MIRALHTLGVMISLTLQWLLGIIFFVLLFAMLIQILFWALGLTD